MPRDNSWRAEHASGTLVGSAAPTKVECTKGRGFRLRIRNTGTESLDISFDSGHNWYPLPPTALGLGNTGEFVEDVVYHFFYLKSASGTTYSALLFEG